MYLRIQDAGHGTGWGQETQETEEKLVKTCLKAEILK